jgi:hypothetical protein
MSYVGISAAMALDRPQALVPARREASITAVRPLPCLLHAATASPRASRPTLASVTKLCGPETGTGADQRASADGGMTSDTQAQNAQKTTRAPTLRTPSLSLPNSQATPQNLAHHIRHAEAPQIRHASMDT